MISAEERDLFLELYNHHKGSNEKDPEEIVAQSSTEIEPDISALNALAEVSRQHGHLRLSLPGIETIDQPREIGRGSSFKGYIDSNSGKNPVLLLADSFAKCVTSDAA